MLVLLLGTLPGRVSSAVGDRGRSQNASSGLPHPVFQLGGPGEAHVVKGKQRPGCAVGASARSLRWLPPARAACRWMELPGEGPRTPSSSTPSPGQTVINEANLSAPGAVGGVEEGRPSICLGCQGNCLQPSHVPPAVPPAEPGPPQPPLHVEMGLCHQSAEPQLLRGGHPETTPRAAPAQGHLPNGARSWGGCPLPSAHPHRCMPPPVTLTQAPGEGWRL